MVVGPLQKIISIHRQLVTRGEQDSQASTMYSPGNVDATLTEEVIIETMNGFLMPELVKKEVP